MRPLEPPQQIIERYQQLCNLIESKSQYGHIPVKDYAAFMGYGETMLKSCIRSGSVPFAFANKALNHPLYYISVTGLYQFEMQMNFLPESLSETIVRNTYPTPSQLRKEKEIYLTQLRGIGQSKR